MCGNKTNISYIRYHTDFEQERQLNPSIWDHSVSMSSRVGADVEDSIGVPFGLQTATLAALH